MIHGIGIDITEIDRMRDIASRYGDHFIERIFTSQEAGYCLSKNDPYPHLAARFAAKEAFIKALAPISLSGISLKEIEIIAGNGERYPRLILHGQTRIKVETAGITRMLVSLSHNRSQAIAQVVLERVT